MPDPAGTRESTDPRHDVVRRHAAGLVHHDQTVCVHDVQACQTGGGGRAPPRPARNGTGLMLTAHVVMGLVIVAYLVMGLVIVAYALYSYV
ncbi:hypothetical protein Vqi01_20410 [Micromonospora qiuiae]|uniref:Uncharacterized protein n=1 Tax=Micromonospora qiuiae TaxID=502268 RepID=A0ABQ4J9M7_9ACTN|nr:hypothetical protein Vqi01_20410 [Micromonospora qiuiae]